MPGTQTCNLSSHTMQLLLFIEIILGKIVSWIGHYLKNFIYNMIFISVHLNILNYRCHYSSQIPSLHAGMPPPPAMPPPPTPCMPPVPTTSMPPPPARSPGFYPFPNIHQTSGVVSHSMESGSDLLVGHHQVFHNDISIAICKLFNK